MTFRSLNLALFTVALSTSTSLLAQVTVSEHGAASGGDGETTDVRGSLATANTPNVGNDRQGLSDIIVTARRTSETLQRVPVAVSAYSPFALVSAQIETINDLRRVTPGLTATAASANGSQALFLAIRGQAQNTVSSLVDAAVGIYFNGVYYARNQSGNSAFVDLESAEVLRGPQGTLFGRNTTGGALNVRTASPKHIAAGYFKLSAGNYGQASAEGMINAPLSDELASRTVVHFERRGGYAYNPILDEKLGGVRHDIFFRQSILWEPASLPARLLIVADYADYKGNGDVNTVGAIRPDGPLARIYGAAGIDSQQYTISRNPFYRNFGASNTGDKLIDEPGGILSAGGASANLDADLVGIHLKSITAYRQSFLRNSEPLDATPGYAAYGQTPLGPFLPANIVSFISRYRQHQVSQEFQISKTVGKFDIVGGAIYFRESGNTLIRSYVFSATVAQSTYQFSSQSLGAFAQGTYHLSDSIRVTGGLRYTWDTRVKQEPSVTSEVKFSYPAWLASIDYQIAPSIFIYAKTSGASLSGGFNDLPTPVGFSSFRPEHVKDMEFGYKGDYLYHHLRTNVAAFYVWRDGVQNPVNAYDSASNSLTAYVTNAGNVRAHGIEFEGTALPWHGMEITSSASYLDANYRQGSFLVPGVRGLVDHSAEPVLHAPKWTFNVGVTQSIDVSHESTLTLHVDYSRTSAIADYKNTPDPNDPTQKPTDFAIQNQLGTLPGYGLLNGRISYLFNHSNAEVALYVRNATQSHYFTGSFDNYVPLGVAVYRPGFPRMFGASVSLKW